MGEHLEPSHRGDSLAIVKRPHATKGNSETSPEAKLDRARRQREKCPKKPHEAKARFVDPTSAGIRAPLKGDRQHPDPRAYREGNRIEPERPHEKLPGPPDHRGDHRAVSGLRRQTPPKAKRELEPERGEKPAGEVEIAAEVDLPFGVALEPELEPHRRVRLRGPLNRASDHRLDFPRPTGGHFLGVGRIGERKLHPARAEQFIGRHRERKRATVVGELAKVQVSAHPLFGHLVLDEDRYEGRLLRILREPDGRHGRPRCIGARTEPKSLCGDRRLKLPGNLALSLRLECPPKGELKVRFLTIRGISTLRRGPRGRQDKQKTYDYPVLSKHGALIEPTLARGGTYPL